MVTARTPGAPAGPRAIVAGGFPADPILEKLRDFPLEASGIALAAAYPGRGPVVGRGAGVRIDGARVRITLRDLPNRPLIEALTLGAPLAATFSQPTTHRSIQIKAARAEIDPDPGPEDAARAAVQAARFGDELRACAYAPEFVRAYTDFAPHELLVVVFVPERVFDQTPGPGAGAALS